MAIIMQNPDNIPSAVSTGYQLQNELLYAGNTGLCNVHFSDDYTKIISGSVFELNGKLIKCTADETIAGIGSIASNSYFFIYAIMGTTTVSFQANTTAPTWNTGKCGFYNGNNRALVKVAKITDKFFKQVDFQTKVTNSYLIKPAITNTETCIFEKNVAGMWNLELPTGWYYVTLHGAGGGDIETNNYVVGDLNGGNGGSISKQIFFVTYKMNANIIVGTGGKNGKPASQYNVSGQPSQPGGSTILEMQEIGISFAAYGGGGVIPGSWTPQGNNSNSGGGDGGNNMNTTKGGGSAGADYRGNIDSQPGAVYLYSFL